MSSLHSITKACVTIFALSTFVLIGSAQIASASTGGFASSINDYVRSRMCESFARLTVGRPHLSLPAFCGNSSLRPTVDISASPTIITVGQSAVVSWTSGSATSCVASGSWNGSKVLNGSESVSPASTATYTISCTNANGSTSDSVTITVNPIPQQPGLAFSASPTTITQGSTTVLTWSSVGTTGCSATGGWSGSRAVSGSQTFSPIVTTDYGIRCTGAGGTISGTTTVTVVPASVPILTLTSTPSNIMVGATSTLVWNSNNTSSCVASGGWSGARALSGNLIVSPGTTTSYVLDCHGLGGHVQATTTVTVTPTPQPTLTFTANPATILNGATSTLAWTSTNATTCVASGGWGGSPQLTGTFIVSPSTSTTFVLTCHGLGGHVQATTTIAVTPLPMPTVTLTGVPGTIQNGATSTLSWSSTNASSCNAAGGWSGAKTLSGSLIVSPATTTVYALNCIGSGGAGSATTTIVVTAAPMPTLTFSATPATTTGTSTLAWVSAHATSCNASLGWSGSPGLSGTLIVSPATTTVYVLDCHGLGGHVQATTTVQVATSTLALASVASAASFESDSNDTSDSSRSFVAEDVVEEEDDVVQENNEEYDVKNEIASPSSMMKRIRSDMAGRMRR